MIMLDLVLLRLEEHVLVVRLEPRLFQQQPERRRLGHVDLFEALEEVSLDKVCLNDGGRHLPNVLGMRLGGVLVRAARTAMLIIFRYETDKHSSLVCGRTTHRKALTI